MCFDGVGIVISRIYCILLVRNIVIIIFNYINRREFIEVYICAYIALIIILILEFVNSSLVDALSLHTALICLYITFHISCI